VSQITDDELLETFNDAFDDEADKVTAEPGSAFISGLRAVYLKGQADAPERRKP